MVTENAATAVQIMVLISNGNSEIDAHVRSNLCYLICSRHLIRSRPVTDQISFSIINLFFFMDTQDVLSYHLTKVPWFRKIIPTVNFNRHLLKFVSARSEI